MLLALYFLLLSGSRSALMATAMGYLYVIYAHNPKRANWSRWIAFFLLVGAFFAANVFSSVLVLLSGSNQTVNEVFTHSAGGVENTQEAAKSVARVWIWAQHWAAFSGSPLFGIGTFDFDKISDGMLRLPTVGSESFLTGLLARLGLLSVFCMGALVGVASRAMREGNQVAVAMVLIIVCAMFGYGSIVTSHDFVFLALLSAATTWRQTVDISKCRWRRIGAGQPSAMDVRATSLAHS
jgi:O-antigen ligase